MAAATESGLVRWGDRCALVIRLALGSMGADRRRHRWRGYLHLRWLPSHGINGWTGEPKEKYYELIEATRAKHPNLRAFVPSATEETNPKN